MSLMKAILLKRCVAQIATRSVATSTVVDPIQKLFLDKVNEYASKSQNAGGRLVDSTPQVEKSMSDELLKLQRKFNATGQDMTKFPKFTFADPTLEAVGVEVEVTSEKVESKKAETESSAKERLYYDI